MQSPCLKVIDLSSISNKRIGVIILHTDLLKYSVFKFLENGVNFDFLKCYLLLTSSCLYLGTLEENYILSVMWR